MDCLTEKDLDDLKFGLTLGFDYVALSFVRRASDIERVKSILGQNKVRLRLLPKLRCLKH